MSYPSERQLASVAALKAWLDSPPTGGVTSVTPTIGALGSGYTAASAAVTDALGSGTGATVTPVIIAGQITSYVVTAKGQNYVQPVVIVSGDGVGAAADAFIGADAALLRLIGAVSSGIVSLLSIPIIFDSGSNITEKRHGNGTSQIDPHVQPIISVSGVSIGVSSLAVSDGTSAGYQFDTSTVYLISSVFPKGTLNVTLTYRAGEVLGSAFQQELEQWCLMTCARVWKKRPHEPNVSEQVAGIGTITFSQSDVPDLVRVGIRQRQRVMGYDL